MAISLSETLIAVRCLSIWHKGIDLETCSGRDVVDVVQHGLKGAQWFARQIQADVTEEATRDAILFGGSGR